MRGIRFRSKTIGLLIGQYWVTIFLWFLVVLLATSRQAVGKTRVANLDSFRALERAEECSIFRSLYRRMAVELSDIKQRLEYQMKSSADTRQRLEICAQEKGLPTISDDSESLAAGICSEDFRSWMSVGYRVRIAREDLVSVREGLQTLHLQMNWSCPSIPAKVPVSVPVPSMPVPRQDGGAVQLMPVPAIDVMDWTRSSLKDSRPVATVSAVEAFWAGQETRVRDPRSRLMGVAAVQVRAKWTSRQQSRGPRLD